MTAKRCMQRTSRNYDACGVCGSPLPVSRADDVCKSCQSVRKKAVWGGSKPIPPVRYIAGYVPPKGSVVMALLHSVHPPIRGIGM